MGVQAFDNPFHLDELSLAVSDQKNETLDPFPELGGNHAPGLYHLYAINIWGTQKVLTCTEDKKIILDSWKGEESQQFEYGLRQGFPVISGPAAADGLHYYLGPDSSGVLICQGSEPRGSEHMHLRADPNGGFRLWFYDSKRRDYFVPISEVSPTELRMEDSGATRFGLTRLDRYEEIETGLWGGRTLLSDSPTKGKLYG